MLCVEKVKMYVSSMVYRAKILKFIGIYNIEIVLTLQIHKNKKIEKKCSKIIMVTTNSICESVSIDILLYAFISLFRFHT